MSIKRRSALAVFLGGVGAILVFGPLGQSGAHVLTSTEVSVTFTKDVAPIFFAKCAECHRPGESAPMSLLTYRDARPWAKSIREKVASREMPPWHADPNHGEWLNDRRLTAAEIEKIVSWVDGGAKEGDPKALPPAPKFTTGWTIGQPDLVLSMQEEYTLEASGADEYQYFEIPTNFKEDVYIEAFEARPGNRKIVHHIIAFIRPPEPANGPRLSQEEMTKRRAQAQEESIFYRDGSLVRARKDAPVYDDGCALPSGGAGFRRDGTGDRNAGQGYLGGYAPGHNPEVFGPGVAKRIPAGSTIQLQLHYSKVTGQVEKDRSMVGFIFAKRPPEKVAQTRWVQNNYFQIPPGAENFRGTACWTLANDSRLYSILPHMHYRGRSMEFKAIYPDGRQEILLNVPRYNFAWQTQYYFKQPRLLPKGTKVMITAYFDNSAKNRFNLDPTKAVRWGDPTYDEMLIGFIDYVVERPPVAKVDPAVYDYYVGRYQVAPGLVLSVIRDGARILGQAPMQPKVELLPASETRFFAREAEIEVTFVRDGKGEVSEAVLDFGGRSLRAKKIKDVDTGGN